MLLSRLSRELISSPSLQACRQEMTFWLSMVPGRMVSPDRLPRKYWVKRGFVTSPPATESQADISRQFQLHVVAAVSTELHRNQRRDIQSKKKSMVGKNVCDDNSNSIK